MPLRELTDTPDDFPSRDRIEIAVGQLWRAGLLHRRPVRAADACSCPSYRVRCGMKSRTAAYSTGRT